MGLLNILLLLTASLACALANITTYGQRENNTVSLVASVGYADSEKKTEVTFNHDKRYELTIHMVMVYVHLESYHCDLISGGPLTDHLTLELSPRNVTNQRVEIFISGVMNKEIQGKINFDDVKFAAL